MIPKGCKRLAEAVFPIAEESRRAAQDWPAARQARAGETERKPHEPIQDLGRFPWHEVTKVAHYWLEVNAMTRSMQAHKDETPYGKDSRP